MIMVDVIVIPGDPSDDCFHWTLVHTQVYTLPYLLGNHMLVAMAIGGKTYNNQPHPQVRSQLTYKVFDVCVCHFSL